MKQMAQLGLLCSLLVAGCAEVEPSPATLMPHYEPALSAVAQAALEARQAGVRNAPTDPESWRQLGSTYLADRHYDAAISCFQELVRLDPAEGSSWLLLGVAWEQIGDDGQAMEAYVRGHEATRPCTAAAWRAALLNLDAGQAKTALALAESAVRADERDVMARLVLGRALMEVDMAPQAQQVLKSVVAQRPAMPYARLLLGKAQQRIGDEAARANLRLGSGSTMVWADQWSSQALMRGVSGSGRFRVATALFDQGKFDRAIHILRALVAEYPSRVDYRVMLAQSLRAVDTLDEALSLLESVLQDDPKSHAALSQAAGVLFRQWQQDARASDLQVSLAYLDRAVDLTQTDGRNWVLRAEVRRASGDLEGAAADLERAADLWPHRPSLALQAAQLRLLLGEHEASLQLLDDLKADFPRDVKVLALQGQVYLALGRTVEAESVASDAAMVNPDHPAVQSLIQKLQRP